jgi:rubrerythrin
MPTTQENLMSAFAGESQANRKYLAYAGRAQEEGFDQVAKLFRAAAEAETIHAQTHLRNAGKLHDTLSNLEDAIAGETYEFTTMYPEMIREAQTEGNAAVRRYFEWVNKVEEVHANLYKKALEAKGSLAKVDYYICPVCGYTHEGPFSGKCPVCSASDSVFRKVD